MITKQKIETTLLGGIFASIILLVMGAGTLKPPTKSPFNFNDVEDHVRSKTDEQARQMAEDYLNEQFPKGTSIRAAMAALTGAGAICTDEIDPKDPGNYFCDYTRRAHGVAGLFIQLDWGIVLYFTPDRQKILYIRASRYETGP